MRNNIFDIFQMNTIYKFEIDIANSVAEPIAEDTPHIYNVENACKLAKFCTTNKMSRSDVKKGFWYYQWDDVEKIKSERNVMVYNEVNNIHMLYTIRSRVPINKKKIL